MSATVRRATRADAAKVAEFALSLFELHAALDSKRFTQIATRHGAEQYYGERTEAENAAVLVAEVDGQIKGFAYLEYEPVLYADLATRVAWLHDIYVEPDARRLGIGSLLLSTVRDEAQRLGANKVLLTAAAGNIQGQKLFMRNGFRTTMFEMMLEIEDYNG